MSAGLTGMLLGLLGAVGVVLVISYAPPFRSVRLVDRLAPYIHDTPPPSRLLGTATEPGLLTAVRAGLSLPEALSALSTRGPEVLRPPFARFAAEYRSSGRFSVCLDRLKDDLADPVGDRIVETLRVAREVGGSDLGRVLRTLATFLREDARARAELETRQGWVVSAARLAVAAPWVVLLLLATQSTTLAAYDSPLGTAILVGGGAVCLVAYRLMVRIGRLPEDVRVLQ